MMESFKSNTKISIERNGKKYDDVNIRYDQTLNYKKKQINKETHLPKLNVNEEIVAKFSKKVSATRFSDVNMKGLLKYILRNAKVEECSLPQIIKYQLV